jgi:hypothetical protein
MNQNKTKMNFRPIYDDTEDIVERVQSEARAPFSRTDLAEEMENLKPFAANGHHHNVVGGNAVADNNTIGNGLGHDHSHSHGDGCC